MLWVLLILNALSVGVGVATLLKCNRLHSPAPHHTQTPLAESADGSYDTSTVRLVHRDRRTPDVELSLHVPMIRDVMSYHGLTFKRRHTLKSGVHVFDEVK